MEALLCSLEDPEVQIIKSNAGETPLLLTALQLIVDLEFLDGRKAHLPNSRLRGFGEETPQRIHPIRRPLGYPPTKVMGPRNTVSRATREASRVTSTLTMGAGRSRGRRLGDPRPSASPGASPSARVVSIKGRVSDELCTPVTLEMR